jgi:hypothetical protein
MNDIVHSFIEQNPSHPVVKSLIGIASDRSGRVSNQTEIDNLTLSMKAIVNHHLRDMADEKKAGCTAEILFNSSLFDGSSIDKVAHKVAQGVNSTVFSPVALLNTIDCHVGSLNDTGATQYARIGSPKRGQSLLNKRHHLSKLRKFCNMLVDSLFQVQHDETTRHGESICVDLERQIRFLVKQYGLKDIAVNDGGVQIAITGNGAALTTSSRKAGQTCLGIKMVDRRCRDPMTKQPCFAVTEETEINVESLLTKMFSRQITVSLAQLSLLRNRDTW